MAIRSKIATYSKEVAYCFLTGHSLWDRSKLSWSTLAFHLANGLKSNRGGSDSAARKYTIRYAGRLMDIYLRQKGGDMFIFHEVFGGGIYRPPPQVRPDVHTVVDLGANIGLTTLYLQKYFPNASYLCIEPNPANVAVLRRNVAWMGPRTRVVEAAISDHTGYASFNADALSYSGRLTAESKGIAVRCETLLSVLDRCGIDCVDILKIDIEGAERQLFRSAHAWLPRVQSLVVEVHGDTGDSYDTDQFRADVEAQGFTLLSKTELCPMLWARRG